MSEKPSDPTREPHGTRRRSAWLTVAAIAVVATAAALLPSWTFTDPAVRSRKTTVSTVTLVCSVAPSAKRSLLTVVAQGAGQEAVRITGYPRPSLRKVSGDQRFTIAMPKRVRFVSLHVDPSAVDTAQATMTSRDTSRLSRGVASQVCAPAATQWWFVGAAGTLGRDDVLLLSNPESAAAVVNVELITDHGIMTPAMAQAMSVPAYSQRIIRLNTLIAGRAAAAVHVTTTGGRIHASVFARVSSGRFSVGSEWLPSTSPEGSVIPLPSDVGQAALIVAAPGDAASVKVIALGANGQFAPAGLETFAVPAGHARRVRMPDIASNASALLITSSSPVVAGYVAKVEMESAQRVPDIVAAAGMKPTRADQTLAAGGFPRGRTAVIAAGPRQAVAGSMTISTGGSTDRVTFSVPAGSARRVQLPTTSSDAFIHATADKGSGPYTLYIATRANEGAQRDAASLTATVRSTSVVLRAVVNVP